MSESSPCLCTVCGLSADDGGVDPYHFVEDVALCDFECFVVWLGQQPLEP